MTTHRPTSFRMKPRQARYRQVQDAIGIAPTPICKGISLEHRIEYNDTLVTSSMPNDLALCQRLRRRNHQEDTRYHTFVEVRGPNIDEVPNHPIRTNVIIEMNKHGYSLPRFTTLDAYTQARTIRTRHNDAVINARVEDIRAMTEALAIKVQELANIRQWIALDNRVSHWVDGIPMAYKETILHRDHTYDRPRYYARGHLTRLPQATQDTHPVSTSWTTTCHYPSNDPEARHWRVEDEHGQVIAMNVPRSTALMIAWLRCVLNRAYINPLLNPRSSQHERMEWRRMMETSHLRFCETFGTLYPSTIPQDAAIEASA